jgi:hypothetical protein
MTIGQAVEQTGDNADDRATPATIRYWADKGRIDRAARNQYLLNDRFLKKVKQYKESREWSGVGRPKKKKA